MSNIEYKELETFKYEEIYTLYNDAGWTNYLDDMDLLLEALKNSLYIYAVYSNNKMIGLIRVVGDGLTIIYIQDLLILNKYQRKGIGSYLLNHILDKYKNVRQIVLMSDEDNILRKFYNYNSFKEVNKLKAISYLYDRNSKK